MDEPVYGCAMCQTAIGAAGCPKHRRNPVISGAAPQVDPQPSNRCVVCGEPATFTKVLPELSSWCEVHRPDASRWYPHSYVKMLQGLLAEARPHIINYYGKTDVRPLLARIDAALNRGNTEARMDNAK